MFFEDINQYLTPTDTHAHRGNACIHEHEPCTQLFAFAYYTRSDGIPGSFLHHSRSVDVDSVALILWFEVRFNGCMDASDIRNVNAWRVSPPHHSTLILRPVSLLIDKSNRCALCAVRLLGAVAVSQRDSVSKSIRQCSATIYRGNVTNFSRCQSTRRASCAVFVDAGARDGNLTADGTNATRRNHSERSGEIQSI